MHKHINFGWNILNPAVGEFIHIIPAEQRIGEKWYQGTADAVFQNLYTIEREFSERVLILSGDHIYKMDYGEMIEFHRHSGAELTIAVIAVDRPKATQLGVLEVDGDNRIIGFDEKPADPRPVPNDPSRALVSMGIYVFNTNTLMRKLVEDAKTESEHDFGKNIIPSMIGDHKVMAYNFKDLNKKKEQYWRDIGDLDSYWEASRDLVSVDPQFNLYDRDWPIHTYRWEYPPAKTVFAQKQKGGRIGMALDSIVSDGSIISGGAVQKSILSCNVRIHSYAEVFESVLMADVDVGRNAKIKRAIIDKGVKIPPGMQIGYDSEEDARNFTITPNGIVVVPKEMRL